MVSNNCHVKFISSSIRLKYSYVVACKSHWEFCRRRFLFILHFVTIYKDLNWKCIVPILENDLAETSKFGQIKTFIDVFMFISVG